MINLQDFFKYYTDTKNQVEAVKLLEGLMPPALLQDDSVWVVKYREAVAPTFSFDSPLNTKITENFTYAEFANNEEARRFYNSGQCAIAMELAEFLEDGRKVFGPLKITSGHRPPAINAAVGGATNSEHVYPINGDGKEFERWCDNTWPYSIGYGMDYRGFVHVGIRQHQQGIRWDY